MATRRGRQGLGVFFGIAAIIILLLFLFPALFSGLIGGTQTVIERVVQIVGGQGAGDGGGGSGFGDTFGPGSGGSFTFWFEFHAVPGTWNCFNQPTEFFNLTVDGSSFELFKVNLSSPSPTKLNYVNNSTLSGKLGFGHEVRLEAPFVPPSGTSTEIAFFHEVNFQKVTIGIEGC